MRPTRRRDETSLRLWRGVALAALAVPLSLQAGGCGDAGDVPASRPPDRPPTPGSAPAVSGTYRTSLTFVTFGGDSSALHLRFVNRTDQRSLRREYEGWFIAAGGWQRLLKLYDELPTPTAAWRVLPGGPLRIGIGGGAEISSVRLAADSGRSLNLLPEREIAHWTGVTGQIESLRTATLRVGSSARSGLLLTRQAGAPTGSPLAAITAEAALLIAENGDGILLLRTGDDPEEAATAWTWIDGIETEWTDAAFLPRRERRDSTPRWSLTVPEAGIMGDLRANAVIGVDAAADGGEASAGEASVDEASADEGTPPERGLAHGRLMRLTGSLLIGGSWRSVVGAAVRTPALPGATEEKEVERRAAADTDAP